MEGFKLNESKELGSYYRSHRSGRCRTVMAKIKQTFIYIAASEAHRRAFACGPGNACPRQCVFGDGGVRGVGPRAAYAAKSSVRLCGRNSLPVVVFCK